MDSHPPLSKLPLPAHVKSIAPLLSLHLHNGPSTLSLHISPIDPILLSGDPAGLPSFTARSHPLFPPTYSCFPSNAPATYWSVSPSLPPFPPDPDSFLASDSVVIPVSSSPTPHPSLDLTSTISALRTPLIFLPTLFTISGAIFARRAVGLLTDSPNTYVRLLQNTHVARYFRLADHSASDLTVFGLVLHQHKTSP